jgi:putative lipid kinase YegS-like protein
VTRPLRPGEPWGQAASGPPDVEVVGDDPDLAAVAMSERGALVRFRPSPRSDFARALGLGPASTGVTEVAIDALAIEPDDGAVNAVVVGTPPDRLRWTTRASAITVLVDGRPWFRGRATTVVVASGQFLRGADLVPRGHPGDGWAEVQVYALTRRARRPMRRRLPTGTHVPHPAIRGGRARRVEVEVAGRSLPLEVDGRPRGRTARLGVTLVPAAIRLLV